MGKRKAGIATYEAIHNRIFVSMGPAKAFLCSKCEAPAHDWAYDGNDPDEIHGTNNHEHSVVYSQKVEHYLPMCRKCHRHYDAQRHRGEVVTQANYGFRLLREFRRWPIGLNPSLMKPEKVRKIRSGHLIYPEHRQREDRR